MNSNIFKKHIFLLIDLAFKVLLDTFFSKEVMSLKLSSTHFQMSCCESLMEK